MKPKIAAKSDSTHPKRQNESTREGVLEATPRGTTPGEEELKRDDEDCKWEPGRSEEEVDGEYVHDDRRRAQSTRAARSGRSGARPP